MINHKLHIGERDRNQHMLDGTVAPQGEICLWWNMASETRLPCYLRGMKDSSRIRSDEKEIITVIAAHRTGELQQRLAPPQNVGSLSPLQYGPSSALLFLCKLPLHWSSSDANRCALLPFYAQQWRFGNF